MQEGSRSGVDLLMVHLDVIDLIALEAPPEVETGAQEALAPDALMAEAAASSSGTDIDQLYEASLEGLEWLDSLVKAIMQAKGVKDRLLLTLILSAQGEDLGSSSPSHESNITSHAFRREKHIQRAADAAGMPVPPNLILPASSSFEAGLPSAAASSLLSQEVMRAGGTLIDPGAFVMTPGSAMLAIAASSGQRGYPGDCHARLRTKDGNLSQRTLKNILLEY